MVHNLCSPRSGNPVANQFVIFTANGTYFQSYRTMIAKIGLDGKVTLSGDWCYSSTTSKYLYQFLSRYSGYGGLNKSKVSKLIENGTFEVVDNFTM